MKGLNPEKLIQYLILHCHWSPFEMVDACVQLETTLDIATQILRHRSFTFQQFSMRYANSESAFNETETVRETRLAHPTNRQSSLETTNTELCDEWNKRQREMYDLSRKNYNWAIENGIAKEVARCVLPQATNTRLYMKGSIRSFIHYVQLRSKPDTQKEHREIALEVAKAISGIFPQIMSFVYKDPKESCESDIEKALMS